MLLKTKTKLITETRRHGGNQGIFVLLRRWLLGAACVAMLAIGVCAQSGAKRLILKDGSYQLATQWDVKGERVRYYSAERFDWEELPTSLVDWNATNAWDKEHSAEVSEAAAAQVAADKAEEEAATPTVAPGVRLPDAGGVFMLDVYRSAPGLVELVQNGTQINKQTGKNILRAVINPLPSGPKQTIELKNPHARVQSHIPQPAIYVNINYDADAATAGEDAIQVNKEDRFKIVRVKQEKTKRVIAGLKISLLGSMKEQRDVVPTQVESVGTDWVKVTPARALEPGEYALVEMLTPTQMNLYVWDFGVDPAAPQNPSAWKAAKPNPLPTATDESPVLAPRPKK